MRTSTLKMATAAMIFLFIAVTAFRVTRAEDCSSSTHTTLILIDKTDSLSMDALYAAKERIWTLIQEAPQFSQVVFREIVGNDADGAARTPRTDSLCRGMRPDGMEGFKGKAQVIREKWRVFQNEVCGSAPESNVGTLACNDPKRMKDGILDRAVKSSQTSPILESVVDSARQYLTTKDQSWTLVILSDWRQFGGSVDLHMKPCNASAMPNYQSVPALAQKDKKTLSVSGAPTRSSKIVSLFALRSTMTNSEADCLQRFSEGFLLTQIEGGTIDNGGEPRVLPPETYRLPRS